MKTTKPRKSHPLDLTPDDRRFLDQFRNSRVIVMAIVYSITIGIAIALMKILSK